jgi:hypothetical protein
MVENTREDTRRIKREDYKVWHRRQFLAFLALFLRQLATPGLVGAPAADPARPRQAEHGHERVTQQ